jgi:hypothetical protein
MRKIFTLLFISFSVLFFAQADNATFNWFLAGGGTGADRSADVVTDANGNIFTADYFLNSATFNGVTVTGSAKGSGANYDNSLFISKISPAKSTLWTISSNVGVVTPVALATTPNGDLIVTGTIRAVANTAGQTTTANIIDALGTVTTFTGLSSTIVQSFVAKFNANGAIQWVKEFDSGTAKDKAVTATALAADGSGNAYLAATYATSIVLTGASSTTLASTNTTQAACIAKLDATTGDLVWVKNSSGSILTETISALTIADDGALYAAGIFQNATTPINVTIGSTTFKPSSGYDLTLIKLSTEGVVSYIQNRSNTLDTRVKDLVVKSGKAYIAGSFKSGTGGVGIKLANGTTNIYSTTTAYLNGFLLAFNSETGADLWQKTVIAPAIAEVNGLAIGSDDNLYAFGYHYNALGTTVASAAVNFGDGITLADTPTSNKLGDLFLSSYNATSGTTKEVHLVASGSGSETANSLTSYGNNLYLLGSSNSAPLTFKNGGTYTTSGSYDFVLSAYTLDIVPPAVTISSASSSVTNLNPIPVTITFSEDVSGFTVSDLSVSNGSAGNFVAVNGSTYTADIIPTVSGLVTVDIAAGAATDAATNSNVAATQFTRTYLVPPTVTISSGTSSTTNANPIPVTIIFNKDVTGFTVSDLTVTNGSAGNFVAVSASIYTADIIPTASGLVTVDIAAGAASDAATNGNVAATQFTRTYLVPPTVTISSATSSVTKVNPIPVTITFNEDVTGFTLSDLTVTNGSAGNFVAVSASIYTANIIPTASGLVTVDIAAGAASDAATNGNVAATQFTRTYLVPPTVTISSATPSVTKVNPIPVTITFNEDVTGFTLSDLTVTNGSAGNFVAVSASTYTADIIPTALGLVTVDIAAGAASDAATNGNIAAAQFARTYDIGSGVENVKDQVFAYSSDNGIVIVAAGGQDATIYSVIGQLVKKTTLSSDKTFVALSPGFYAVFVKGQNIKVLVK